MRRNRFFLIILISIFLSPLAYAFYWVSPTGAATWANCNSSSSLDSTFACSLATANTNARAGDTIYLRNGSYQSNAAINPSYNGSAGNPITFTNYNSEQVILENCFHESICGVKLYFKDYIKVNGIQVQNSSMMLIIDNGDYNEISNCVFNSTIFRPSGAYAQIFVYHNATNNWIHNNTFSNNGYVNVSNCNDEGALLTLGAYGQSNDYTSYNLIENNTLFHGGHHTLQITSPYNVIRGNYFHNENWMNGSWCNSSFYGDAGNRNIEIGDESGAGNVLIENNRIAYAGIPPDSAVEANNLVTNLELVTNNNIARYNYIYGSSGSGVMFYPKNGAKASNNSLYSNTIYSNGYSLMSRTQGGIFINNATNNSIKNNILYDNKWGNFTWLQVSAANNTLLGNWYNETGDPLFVNSTLGAVEDISLPNLSLQNTSLAINSGLSLTIVSALDSGSGTQLILDDSKYFQDGSWGPTGLVEPDWIAVTNSSNIVKINSINYSTNTLTLNSSISRVAGDSVWLYSDSSGRRVLYGDAPEVGAYEIFEETYVPFCGNNITDPGEVCDGNALNGYSCASVAAGLKSGTLSCSLDCTRYNTSQCVQGDKYYAASCNRTDVNNTLNSASSGDIVIIPAGECDWNGSLTLGSKSVLISGSGNLSTIIRNIYPASGSASSIFRIYGQEGNPVRITNLWIKGGRSLGIGSGWNIYPYGNLSNFRIDHCRFTEGGQIRPEGTNWGVIDHNEFIDTTAEVISMRDWVSEGISWNMSIWQILGTGSSLFVEDNFFNSTNSSYHTHTITGACGSRYTYRENVAYKSTTFSDVDLHGYCFDECTSGRSFEVYNNEFYALTNGYGWAANLRGGEGVVFNNSFIHNGGGYANVIYMQDYRAHTNCAAINRSFKYGGPINCTYVNGSNSSTWEWADRACRYQIHNTYIWNNTRNGLLSLGGVKTEDASYIVENRDFYAREPSAEIDGFDYVPYPYPHPLTLIDVSILDDTTSPASITNLQNISSGTTWIYWNWSNPADLDFNSTILYLNNINIINLSSSINYYNATSLLSNTEYVLRIQTRDQTGNLNTTVAQSAARTLIEPGAPNITLLLPQDRFGVGRDVGFVFNVTSLSTIANCSLLIDNLVNATNISITSTTNRFFVQNLSSGKHIWRITCVDENDVEGYSMIRSFGVHNFTKFNGNTTNLLEVNLSNISRLTFENVSSGKIIFSSSIDLSNSSDLESHIAVSNNSISIDSASIPELNISAVLTLYNLSFTNPRVLKNGIVCSDCIEDSYVGGVFTFNVTSFSTYSSEETPISAVVDTPSNSGGGGGGTVPVARNLTNNLSDIENFEDINNIGNENNKTPEEIKQENFEKFEKKVNYAHYIILLVIILIISRIIYKEYKHFRKK